MNSAVPENLASDINSFTSSLKNDLGDSLVSVVLYGGVVKNEMIKETDRVKIMIVVKNVKISSLDKVGDALLSTADSTWKCSSQLLKKMDAGVFLSRHLRGLELSFCSTSAI